MDSRTRLVSRSVLPLIFSERKPMPNVEQQNRVIACAGRKGSGKSTMAKEILPQCPRLFIYDTMGEHRWVPDTFEDLDKACIYLMESSSYESFTGRNASESDD